MRDSLAGPEARPSSRGLPALGARGEGWVALQAVLLVLAVAAGTRGPRWPGITRTWRVLAAVPLFLVGAALALGGSWRLGRQLTPFPRPLAAGELKDRGVYALVRHPIYGGVILVAWAWALVSSPLALLPAALALPFFEAKRHREEAWLLERHARYREYRRHVRRRFLPFVW